MRDDDTIAQLARDAGELLARHGLVLATAESCTGGMVAGAVTDVAGSSAWFDRGFVTYSNAAKTALLDVPQALLASHGAVSEETARAMAEGALRAAGTDVALATTGIAGPGGATPGKPVGLVWFGWAWRLPEGIACRSARQVFPGDRAAVRSAAVAYALRGLLVGPPVR